MISSSLRGEFSLPPEKVYLNCAFMAPVSKRVEEAGVAAIRMKRDPSLVSPYDFFESSDRVRSEFARLINAPDPEQISLGPAASYGIATAAKNISFSSDDEIIVLHDQFPSHVYPWRRRAQETGATIVTVRPTEGESWDSAILRSFTHRTRAICIPVVHWTDGTLFDVQTISERARDSETFVVIDGTQSVGALPFDVQRVHVDALICAGYKWLTGPYGTSVTYWSSRFSNGIPIEENWITRQGSEDFASLVSYSDNYQPGAVRYDAGGRSAFVQIAMLLEALRQVNGWQPKKIQEHCDRISSECVSDLAAAGFSVPTIGERANHLFGIRVPEELDPESLADYLRQNNISVSVRGTSVRVAPNVYNDQNDFNQLKEVILDFARQPAY